MSKSTLHFAEVENIVTGNKCECRGDDEFHMRERAWLMVVWKGQSGMESSGASPGAVGRIGGWAVMCIDPIAIGVTLLAEGVLGVLYADTAAV